MRPSLLSFNVRRTYHRFTYLIALSFYGWAARENVSFFDSYFCSFEFLLPICQCALLFKSGE